MVTPFLQSGRGFCCVVLLVFFSIIVLFQCLFLQKKIKNHSGPIPPAAGEWRKLDKGKKLLRSIPFNKFIQIDLLLCQGIQSLQSSCMDVARDEAGRGQGDEAGRGECAK